MKVGSLVCISNIGITSYLGYDNNPLDEIGKVICKNPGCIRVQWLDYTNVYNDDTLIEINPKDPVWQEFIKPIKLGKVDLSFLNELRGRV